MRTAGGLDTGYFAAMSKDIAENQASVWLEKFCQRAMLMQSYSVKNVARILAQNPQATHVAGEQQYKEQGIFVLMGATPIRIYAPNMAKNGQRAAGFSAVDVYDISQTTAAAIPPKTVDVDTELRKACALCNRMGIQVFYADMSASWKVLEGRKLFIKSGIPKEIVFQLILQELGHIAFLQEGVPEQMAFPLSVVASYCGSYGAGLKVPYLASDHKRKMLCNGLRSNLEAAVKMAKRLLRGMGKIKF